MTIQYFQYTDLGNAKRWASLFDQHYKWIHELKQWYRWNGSRWEEDVSGSHVRIVDDVLASLDNEYSLLTAAAANAQDADKLEKKIEANRKWYSSTQSALHIAAMTKLARSQPGISLSFTEFDSKGKYLGVQNGVINLATGEFIKDQPEFLITKSCGAAYDPGAICPEWEKFLNRIFERNREKISFVQRLFGQSLLGTSDKSILTIFCGHGANGKSTLVDTMMTVLGDYARSTSAATITESKGNKEYYLADLKGVRLSVVNESKKGAFLDEELVKSLVDSGKIQARKIYGSPITFQPVTTPIFTTNYPPRITGDYSIARRILYLPFSFQLPLEERNPRFRTEILEPELSGILNWALQGCYAYQEQGLNPPDCILEATKSYVKDNDRCGRFIDECCEAVSTARVRLSDIQEAYAGWLQQKGYYEVGEDRLSNDLRAKGYSVEKRNGGYYYVLGLRLLAYSEIDTSFSDRLKGDLLKAFDPIDA